MITKENYLEEHIREIQLRSRKDPQLIERSLYALGLLEALSSTGMKFIFKGGSCLMLLLPHDFPEYPDPESVGTFQQVPWYYSVHIQLH